MMKWWLTVLPVVIATELTAELLQQMIGSSWRRLFVREGFFHACFRASVLRCAGYV
jgi:hypothetical protein